ncbi:MAG: fumarate hydratase C-terminal domain-containing protein [Clostridia bacterium]|nr:fumarate hydratase C-terminal domain-containing protein [Clostridia bacterium]
MAEYYVNTTAIKEFCPRFKAGDRVFLSGEVLTARDAAHKRLFELLDAGKPLPFDIKGAVIYYAGPTPAPKGLAIGSCGPTTSARMDVYTPELLRLGLAATIGKGERSREVCNAIAEHGSVYLCAIGGAGALAAKHITKSEVIAFDDLGCESVKRLTFDNFPLIVGIDASGGNIFKV